MTSLPWYKKNSLQAIALGIGFSVCCHGALAAVLLSFSSFRMSAVQPYQESSDAISVALISEQTIIEQAGDSILNNTSNQEGVPPLPPLVKRESAPLALSHSSLLSPPEKKYPPAKKATPRLSRLGNVPTQTPSSASVSTAANAPIVAARYQLGAAATPAPAYPLSARRQGKEGRVIIRLHLSTQGIPVQASVLHSSGDVRLDKAAYDTLLKWRLEPAHRAGVAIASTLDVPVRFQLAFTR